MSTNKDVVLWSKENCSYCSKVKAFLEGNEIAYKTIDITDNDQYRDILELKYGFRSVPVVEVGSSKEQVYKGLLAVDIDELNKLIFE